MTQLATKLERKLRPGGRCVFVVGEQTLRGGTVYPSQALLAAFAKAAPALHLEESIVDSIPDVRRARRRAAAVKKEHILVLRHR